MAEATPGEHNLRLFREGHFTDFVVECGGFEFPVHRYCLFAQSDYFRRLFLSSTKETKESRLLLTDLEPSLIARMLIFCYEPTAYPEKLTTAILPTVCGDLVTNDPFSNAIEDSFVATDLALEMHILGDRFGVPELLLKSTFQSVTAFRQTRGDSIAPRSMLDHDRCSALVEKVFASSFSFASGIRDQVLVKIAWHFERNDQDISEYGYIEDLALRVPDLRDALLRRYIGNNTPGSWDNRSYSYISIDVTSGSGFYFFDDSNWDSNTWKCNNGTGRFDPERSITDVFTACIKPGFSGEWVVRYAGEIVNKMTRLKDLGLMDRETLVFDSE